MFNTSEWVSLGHPDKTADYISEYILDKLLTYDKNVRYALEVQVKDNIVNLAGEVTTSVSASKTQYESWVKEALREIGYTNEYAYHWGYENTVNADDAIVNQFISTQSQDIAMGVDNDGWGDQGIFFGLAMKNASMSYMPRDIFYARRFGYAIYKADFCGLDVKTQVTTRGPNIEQLIVAAPVKTQEDMERIAGIVHNICHAENINPPKQLIINGTGRFVKHSSMGDCGITGRKLAVDFYGGNCEIGGGSPWTKDVTKADLTLNAYARKLAVDFIRCRGDYPGVKVKISCCIGSSVIYVTFFDLHGNEISSEKRILTPGQAVRELGFDKISFAYLCEKGIPYVVC